ncbi:MAG: sensor histidine kinase [Brevundimonas sp.]|uniref:sensor histidine kinase n=1 Tax=Brevundimonas sp. TaxID=1871086 RepID=UPI003918A5E7
MPAANRIRINPGWIGGGAGVVALVLLAVVHDHLSGPAMTAALIVALITLGANLRSASRSPVVDDSTAQPAAHASGAESHPGVIEALDALSDPLVIIEGSEPDDLAGRRISFANAAARKLFRMSRSGGLLVTAVRDPAILEAVDEALFGGMAQTTDYESGGAQERVWRAHTLPLEVTGGARRVVLHLRDETDVRRMEHMRVDFLANASHELKTPLASLTGFIETLKGHAREDPVARDRFLDIMAAQAERMSRLVADLLSLSRIELNEHITPSGRVDVGLVAVDVIDALGPLAREKGVEIRLSVPDDTRALITGDRDEIVQVVQNLIDNAVKYSNEGQGVDVSVEAGLALEAAQAASLPGASRLSLLTPDREDDALYIRLCVRDHGRGMEREHLPRLTERFYRAPGQKSGEHPGTGLGLAIVKHIVNRHRGGMTVESQLGTGSQFCVYFQQLEPRPAANVTEFEQADARRNRTVIKAS